MTQVEKIREMASKKLLTSEQKKVLYKLFSAKLDAAIEKFDDLKDEQEEKLSQDLIAKQMKIPAVKKAVNQIKAAIKAAKYLDNLKGFECDFGEYKDDKILEFQDSAYSDEKRHPAIDKLRKEHDAKKKELEALKCKLLADIYGLPMSYDEMTSYLDKEVAKITA